MSLYSWRCCSVVFLPCSASVVGDHLWSSTIKRSAIERCLPLEFSTSPLFTSPVPASPSKHSEALISVYCVFLCVFVCFLWDRKSGGDWREENVLLFAGIRFWQSLSSPWRVALAYGKGSGCIAKWLLIPLSARAIRGSENLVWLELKLQLPGSLIVLIHAFH